MTNSNALVAVAVAAAVVAAFVGVAAGVKRFKERGQARLPDPETLRLAYWFYGELYPEDFTAQL